MCAVFYHDEEQKEAATRSKEKLEAVLGKEIKTLLLPAETFYAAEDYHQKYMLRKNSKLMDAFQSLSPELFLASGPASRVNGYAGGNGFLEDLEKEIKSFGLSSKQEKHLLEMVGAKQKKGKKH